MDDTGDVPDIKNDDGSFFKKVDWTAFWTATAVSFAVYFYTLCPTVGLEDSGELAVAGDWLGVPHPPGYPIWTMMAWVFTKVFAFVKFRGQPNPAWSIGLMSAVFGALSAGGAAMLICRSGRDILRGSSQISHNLGRKTEDTLCLIGGIASSLLFAFTPIMWSQAVIVEVYTLNAFFLVLILLFIYMWIRRPNNKTLFIASFLFGLGLTNYQVILLAGLALAICIMLRNFALFRDFLFAAIPYGAVYALMKIPIVSADGGRSLQPLLPEIVHPTHITAYVYMGLNGLWLTIIYFLLPHGRVVAPSVLLAQVGVAFYAYMPIVSDLRNPPMNWGYPRTWEGFKHAISRGQYEKIIPAHIFSLRFISQIGTYIADLTLNYQLAIALVGFLPFATWRARGQDRDYSMMPVAVALAAISVLLSPLARLAPQAPLYKIPALGVVCITGIGALAIILARMERMLNTHLFDPTARFWERATSIILLVLTAAAGGALVARDVLGATAPLRKAKAALPRAQVLQITKECFVIAAIVLTILLVFAFVYWLLRTRRIQLEVGDDSQQWLMSTTVTFIMLGIGLIALANIKMDIQDTFIQRVKFISSHALFALWIGYGLIFLLAHIDGWVGSKSTLGMLATAIAIGLPIVPIYMNGYNERLLYVYGGAEQNGHDYGWQFGNYQLRGAEAILEELSPDEEPLPNPTFPPEMGPDAIFFGGTDPGRFVPTYMIYSAKVREDVYLITQNALADNTYMSVMRDLYGNDIWIPNVADSAQAFSTYVRDIETGKRPETAGIKKENGRVQVSGVLGVMEINGILAKAIFDHNNYKHDFYVEESYVIRWMYPYLEPHGLIMKINRNAMPGLTKTMLTDDTDFWDWYTRRLTSNRSFMRDVVARKSFSKLRSAIAGLYAHRGLRNEAEIAFNEARTLYPLSPEANFRLAEVYMRSKQLDKARKLITEFGEMDPANTKAEDFIKQIDRVADLHERIAEMEKETLGGKLSADKALQLAELYRQSGQIGRHNALLNGIRDNKDLPPIVHFQTAQAYERVQQYADMNKALTLCLSRMPENAPAKAFLDIAHLFAKGKNATGMRNAMKAYVKRNPSDWRAWLDVASLDLQHGDRDGAGASLGVAIRYGGAQAEQLIQKNPALKKLHESRTTRARNLIGLGL
jgi:hypothetical protein